MHGKICDVTGVASNKTEILTLAELESGLPLPSENGDDKLEYFVVVKSKKEFNVEHVSAVHVLERINKLSLEKLNAVKAAEQK